MQRSTDSANRRDGVAVLRPGLLVVAQRRRAILAIADGADPRAPDAPRDQIVTTGVGAALAEGQVVFFGAPIVTVAGHLHADLRIFGEPARLAVQRRAGVRLQRGAIAVEEDAITDI